MGRFYNIDGKEYVSVTTVLGVIAKPGLTNWKVKLGKEESEKITGEAADIGKSVHMAIECYNKGKAFPMPEDKDQQQIVRRAIRDYKKWVRQTWFQPLESELTVYSNKYMYAGTLDCVGLIGNALTICDYKTSKGIWPDNKLQVAAYWNAYGEMTGELVEKLYIIRFSKTKKDKGEIHEIIESPHILFHDFLCALSLWRRFNNNLKPNKLNEEGLKWQQREGLK